MASSAQEKAIVLNLLKQADGNATALQTALHTAINPLNDTSTDAALQAAVAVYDTARTTDRVTIYGNIALPALDAATALAAVKAGAV